MALRTLIVERDYEQGETRESVGINANRLDRFSRILVHRLGWPDTGADVIRITQFYSPDNGQTWNEFGAFTARGGIYILRGGAVLEYHTLLTSAFPGVDNDRRRIKVKVEALAPLRTKVEAETSETTLKVQAG